MKKIMMSGDEAVARGAYEAGCTVAGLPRYSKYRNS